MQTEVLDLHQIKLKGELKMKSSFTATEEKGIQTLATYTITVGSKLTPEEVTTMFNHLTISNSHLNLSNEFGASTKLEIFDIHLNEAEFLDDELN